MIQKGVMEVAIPVSTWQQRLRQLLLAEPTLSIVAAARIVQEAELAAQELEARAAVFISTTQESSKGCPVEVRQSSDNRSKESGVEDQNHVGA